MTAQSVSADTIPSARPGHGVAFAVAMIIVVFLHMVIGEMAPKSWVIAHPERSAMLLSPPFRAVVKVVRPLISLLNRVSNVLVRRCRVAPRDELASVHNREQLTHLVEESERLGLISETDSDLITRSLTEPETPVRDLPTPAAEITSVPAAAAIVEILRRNRASLAVVRDETGRLTGMVTLDDLLARYLQPQGA